MAAGTAQGVRLREDDKDARSERSYGFVTRVPGQQKYGSFGYATDCNNDDTQVSNQPDSGVDS